MMPRTTHLRIPLLGGALALVLGLAGCDESDAVSVRIVLEADLTGRVTTSALVLPPDGGAVPAATSGVEWDARGTLVCNAGSFQRLSDLRFADIEMEAGEGGAGVGFARLLLPRGPETRWANVLMPLSTAERSRATRAIDPSGRGEDVGTVIKIEVRLPSRVVSEGLMGKVRGVKSDHEDDVATLIVPHSVATSEGDPLVWHLTWQR